MANLLITELGVTGDGAMAYDLQVLPYCPNKVSYPITFYANSKDYIPIADGNGRAYSFICFPKQANFTKDIPFIKNYRHVGTQGIYCEWEDITATYNDDGILYMCDVPLTDIPPEAFNIRGHIEMQYGNTIIPCYPLDDPTQVEGPVASWAYSYLDDCVVTFWIFIPYTTDTIVIDEIVGEIEYDYYIYPTPMELKIANECDFCRLTSPNFNGMYQFKLSKFNDGIHNINVDCTYKPFNPYIKLNPDYSFLYGGDYNDATGLILGGDFSLPLMTDPWQEYELANKNYQNIFNRQIQNLDINQQIQREQQDFTAIMGTITGGIGGMGSGMKTGAKVGGAYGAAAGAVIGLAAGTTLGAVGGVKDRDWLNTQLGESRSYAIDQYKYQLGTIQALPQSASKSSPLTYNNKFWPILEDFSCTDKEKEIIRKRIQYNGMNIGAIGSLSDYDTSNEFDKVYVKGQLIRVEDIKDDFHIVDALYQEVDKGFYIKGE